MYQLDAALLDTQTQKNGLVFIYDMSQSRYANFDYELSQKILTLLKVSFVLVLILIIQKIKLEMSHSVSMKIEILNKSVHIC